jgi:heme/copper-type cytochrome/quinol oxidase subunit 1
MIGLVITAFLQRYTVDLFFEDRYFVVTIGHLVMAAATLFGSFAVSWTVFQAWSRRPPHEPLGQAHFWLTLAGILLSIAALTMFSAQPHDSGRQAASPAYLAMYTMLTTLVVQLVFPVAVTVSWFRRKTA